MFDLDISVTVTGIEETLARLEGLEQQIRTNVAEVLRWFGQTVTAEMVATHTFRNRTYRLERSIGWNVESWSGDRVQVNVFALAWYAQAVEEGTPTSRPYPFFWPVFYKWQPELQKRLVLAVNAAYAQFAAGPRRRR